MNKKNDVKKKIVSIIIPTFNRAHLLEKTLTSVRNQTFQDWECLIIDDGSADKTKDLVLRQNEIDERIKYFYRPLSLRKGPSSCRNYGLSLAQGPYIQFFDDDDLMYPTMIQTKLEAIVEHKANVVVAPVAIYHVESKKIIRQNKVSSNQLVEDYVASKLTWYCSGPLWCRDFLTERFDEELQTLEDWDFNLRLIYKKPKVVYLSNPLQRYNKFAPGETLSSRAQLGDEQQIRSGYMAYKKHYLLLKENDLLTKAAEDWLLNRCLYLLKMAAIYQHEISKEIFSFVVERKGFKMILKYWRTILAYYSLRYFKRGYRIFKN